MPKGKPTVKMLMDVSRAAMFCGIEIHNKPNIEYRYPTTVILIINAWELMLKAFVYKYIGKTKIYEKKNHTITISKAIALVDTYLSNKGDKTFSAIKANLDKLNTYRSSNVHYYTKELDPVIFMLIYKSVLDYNKFASSHFGISLADKDNLIVLPIGFRLPIDPVKFLTKEYKKKSSNTFVEGLVARIKDLQAENVDECLLIGVDLNLTSAKKITNADLVAAIDNNNAQVMIAKAMCLTNNPNAPVARIDEQQIYERYPLRNADVKEQIKERRPDLKLNNVFNEVIREIKRNPALFYEKILDKRNPKSQKSPMYAREAVDAVISAMDVKLNNKTAH